MDNLEDLSIDLAGARVLVVEDNEFNRVFACAVLESMGLANVECARNGREGLDKVESFRPDIVLLDLMMPVMNGEEFLLTLRADSRYHALPVLVLSAVVDQATRNALFAAGANDYIGKPIDRLELVARVEVHLRSHLALADLRRYRNRLALDLRTARGMQNALLPTPEQMSAARQNYGLSISAVFKPSSELGGDLWGLVPVDENRLALYAVDFSGHGIAASINTFRLHLMLEDMDAQMGFPEAVLEKVNVTLKQLLPRGQFATMTLVVIDSQARTLSLVNAGGPAPVLAEPGREPRLVGAGGLPLGISLKAHYEPIVMAFPPGSQLSLYSDALIDALDPTGEPLGGEWVAKIVRDVMTDDPAETAGRVMDAFASRSPGDCVDDVTWVQVAG
ncbi:Serine phosphatase RsbU regulator of sigma subunit [Paramagnetospirillum magnetotacticum MS-1]|uniref:Serine phosphatase RsbU regulator of sigma subunit n=1 Tax=Paramagnetospirillum magnetotacticum MS-1 TaxID=272627 RepID=A0A0C2YU84_PARME|nr:SpoIIE family protein phosphatase [Paramagnetospirillum magnetotacticum]KIL98673.1 Serine phosphatase RsbU regulator of sigma subunit [Paramagnetospirillum magnetotacticum MS-1]